MSMNTSEKCISMEEIRADVNAIDREILRLLGLRLAYVQSAVRFKFNEESIKHPNHWESFYAQRRAWGEEEGYAPDVIESLYRRLYEYTIKVQLEIYSSKPEVD